MKEQERPLSQETTRNCWAGLVSACSVKILMVVSRLVLFESCDGQGGEVGAQDGIWL